MKNTKLNEIINYYNSTKGDIYATIFETCKYFDLVYDVDLIYQIKNSPNGYKFIFKEYLRRINSLPQYNKLSFKDSKYTTLSNKLNKGKKIDESLNTLGFLNKEKTSLEQKISEMLKKGDIETYKNLIIAYKEVLRLIKDEDVWQEKFSHYNSDGKELISTWEQKGEDIRNKKTYEVKEVKKVIKDNKILTKQYVETTAMINKTTPMIVYYEKDKDLDVNKFLLNIKAIDYTHYHEFERLYNNTLPNGYSTTDEQSKELFLQINNNQFKVVGGELKDFDVSEYINEGVNTINILDCSQHRVTISYTREGYMNI